MGIPRRIGNVRPFAELARGTTTSVLKAHDPDSNQVVVVKLLRREWAQDKAITARFAAELSALQSVSNDNVVQILDHGDCEEGLFIITEFVAGQTLDELISNRTVPTILGAFIVREALVGLAAVHHAGIIHRDFKSANIVVGDSGVVKLMDFGFAESPVESPAAIYRAVAGTLGYIAPELLSGEAASEQSDIFAAGITLLEATTGVRSRASTFADERTRHAAQNVSTNAIDHIDPDLASLIRQMTEPTPAPRFRDVAGAIEAIDAAIASYRPPVNQESLRKWLIGERQTLPRKLLSIADGGATGAPALTSDAIVRTRNEGEDVTSPFRSSRGTNSSVAVPSVTHGSSGSGKHNSTEREASRTADERARIRKRRATLTAAFLMGSLLVVSVARRTITELFWPDRNEVLAAGPDDAGTSTALPNSLDIEETNRIDADDSAADGAVDGKRIASLPGRNENIPDEPVPTLNPTNTSLSSAANFHSPAVTDNESATNDIGRTNDVATVEDSLNADPPEATVAGAAVDRDDRVRVNSSADSVGQIGILTITASPWAHVAINGMRIGTTPFTTGVPLAPGKHTLVFSNPSFPDLQKVVDVVAADSTPVAVSMWSTVSRLSLVVSPWAEVLIDGVVRDTIPMSAPLIIRPGLKNLTLRHPELGSYSETITFEADSTYIRRYNLFELIDR